MTRLPSCTAVALVLLAGLTVSPAANITWTGGSFGTNTTWRTTGNWDAGVIPTNTDNAIFGAAGDATVVTIQMANANGVQQVGQVSMDPGNFVPRALRNNSAAQSGVLELSSIGGVLLANNSGVELRLLNQLAGFTALPMGVRLANSGEIYVGTAGTTAQILISSSISETNGSRGFTKTGPGTLYLQGTNNTFTGPVTNAAGVLKFNDTATLGNGAGTLYLTGGEIVAGLNRSGLPVANPVVFSATTRIYNDGGTGSERIFPLSGPLSGSSGSLIVGNRSGASGNPFVLRLLGSFTFSLPIQLDDGGADTTGTFRILELFNSGTNGLQTFSGVISGDGSIRREGASSSAAGTSILTGNNTYSGGTLMTYGTVLANNVAGSALGAGAVAVTNQGILGGNGSVVASTSVMLGGTVSPGSTSSNISNLNISDLTLGADGKFVVQVSAATGTAGVNWDLITCSSGWTDAASSGNPVTIKLDSLGVTPTGWNPGIARDWKIIQSASATGFDASHFAIDTTAFVGTIQGVFAVTVVSGELHLTYTPASDIVINVAAGSVTQGQTSPTPYPLLTGTFGVVKVGNGEVVLTNSLNDYIGSTKILAGTASLAVDAVNGSGAFGAAATAVQLGHTTGNSNATLNINTVGVTVARNVTVQSGSSGTKTVGSTISSGTATFAGDIALQDNLTLTSAAGGEAIVSGQITGNGNLNKIGAGAVTISGLNTFAGNTTLSAGTLNLNSAIGNGTFTIAGASVLDNAGIASLTLANTSHVWNADFTFTGTTNLNLGSGGVTLGGNRAVNVAGGTLTAGGVVSGAAGLTKNGAGTLVLNGANTYSGNTTMNAGSFQINGTATYGNGAGTVNWAGGTIILSGTRSTTTGIIPNPVNMTADTTIQNTTTATAGTRNFPFGSSAINASAGTLTIRNITAGDFTNIMNLRFHGNGFTFARPIAFENASALSQVNNTCQVECQSSNGTPAQIFSGVISGPGRVRRDGQSTGDAGTTVLSGANTYTLGVILDDGDLGLGANSTSSGGDVTSGPLGTGMLDWTGNSGLFAWGGARTVENHVYFNGVRDGRFGGTNALTLSGPINIGTVTKALSVNNTALTTFSGALTNTALLIKAGPGTLALTGDNSNSGGWTVTNGTLLVNNTTGSGTGSGNVTVSDAGVIGGTGTIAGAIAGNGGVAPGASAGVLGVGGGLDLSTGGTLVWELAANSTNNPGVNFDQLALTGGNLLLGGASKISINFIGSATTPNTNNAFWQTNRSWRVVTLSGGAVNPGNTTFATVINGSHAAGTFSTTADAGGIWLNFTPGAGAPPTPVVSSAIGGAGTASATISWSSAAGYTYTVQYRTNLNQVGWLTLGTANATGSTASIVDNTGPHAQRFYRVVWP